MSSLSFPDVTLCHSSDLHIGADSGSAGSPADVLSVLRTVLRTAQADRAQLLILAGDTFDNNRQASQLIELAACTMSGFDRPIVILPGNHDPLTPDSVYRRPEFVIAPNVCVLGLTVEDTVFFPELGLEIWGRAHLDYGDMEPLREPPPRSTSRQIVVAHGHYVRTLHDKERRRSGSWLISREDLAATAANYVALGHWPEAECIGGPEISACYSGAPDVAGSVNIIEFRGEGGVKVRRAPLSLG